MPAGSKWSDNVRAVYEMGLMTGVTDTRFDPDGNLTVAQAVAMACRLHDFYCGEEPALPASGAAGADAWYQPYVSYAESHGFVDFGGYTSGELFTGNIDRGAFAGLFWAALPDEALAPVNSVEDGAIPDVSLGMNYTEAVYTLYRAGILTGNDSKGTFTPDSHITRGAAAAIISRMADPSLRKSLTLTRQPFQPVAMKDLANRKSLQKKASDEELAQAYDVALEIVTPLAGLPVKDQMAGIAAALRILFDSGMQYSMSEPHYNDPYGYFVLGVASCAGCARATGLCLNILGIPYEHVNEGGYTHQWCRVNVGGEYWICDAYGLYCGPEPAPYEHPYL